LLQAQYKSNGLSLSAFELADIYRNPSVMLLVGVLGLMMEPVVLTKNRLTQSPYKKRMDWLEQKRKDNLMLSFSRY
jgi:pyruvate/2-oxoacid:ferredoxin oxidoreductase alpha subunit